MKRNGPQCACVRKCAGSSGKDGGAWLQLFADYIQVWKGPGGPPRNRGCRNSADPVFTVLVSGLVLPEGPVGNGGGNATLQSHLQGPPAAWGAVVPGVRGNASRGVRGDLDAAGG